MWAMGEAVCHHVLQEENVQKLIHSTDLHFDLLVTEAFIHECFLGFAHKFKAPIIQVCTYGGSDFMAHWVGSPNPYSYVPDEFLHYTDKMNFWERMHNTVLVTIKHVGRQLIHLPKQNAAMQKYVLQQYRQLAACMRAGIQDVFGPSEHSPQSHVSETSNAKLRAGWRNARETT